MSSSDPDGGDKSSSRYGTMLAMCRQAVDGASAADSVADGLDAFVGGDGCAQSALLDVLQALWQEVDVDTAEAGGSRQRFAQLCSHLANRCVPDDLLRLALGKAYVSPEQANIVQRSYTKMRTRVFYKQQKFNLLREESEGYAKLVADVIEADDAVGRGDEATMDAAIDGCMRRIRCIIGQFNLDPNRVVDIILLCLESRPHRVDFYLALLRAFEADPTDICQIIGFECSYAKEQGESIDVPASMYSLIALLLRNDVIQLVDICKYLAPSQKEILDSHKEREAHGRKLALAARAIGGRTIASQAAGKADGSDKAPQHFDHITDDWETIVSSNQKLGLLCALLEQHDWTRAKWLLDTLPERYAFAQSAHCLAAAVRLVDKMIHNMYTLHCHEFLISVDGHSSADCRFDSWAWRYGLLVGAHALPAEATKPVLSWRELVDRVFPLLTMIGPHIAHDSYVYTKLVRLLSVPVRRYNSSSWQRKRAAAGGRSRNSPSSPSSTPTRRSMSPGGAPADDNNVHADDMEMVNAVVEQDEMTQIDDIYGPTVDIFDNVLLPGSALLGTVAAAEELWHALRHMPYTTRYRMYGRWSALHTKSHAKLLFIQAQVHARTRYHMKRLSKDTAKSIGRQLGKLSHQMPYVVFEHLLDQVQIFENFIGPTVESLKFLSNMGFDMLTYCLIQSLASPDKQKLKTSDAGLSPWLQALSNFVSLCYKRYDMELSGVLQYIINELKDGRSLDLLVLKRLIQDMSGEETMANMTDEHMKALAGGDTLRQEGGRYGDAAETRYRRTMSRLLDALVANDLETNAPILIAQQRASIVFNEGKHIHLKLVSQMLDECTNALMQFGNFVQASLSPSKYSRRMPNARDLIAKCHLPPDAAMFLCRRNYMLQLSHKYESAKKRARAAAQAAAKEAAASDDKPKVEDIDKEAKADLYSTAFDEVVASLALELSDALNAQSPGVYTGAVGAELLAAFWMLRNYDLHLPTAAYEKEIDRVKKDVKEALGNKELKERERKREADRLAQIERKLNAERSEQEKHVERIEHKLHNQCTYLIKKTAAGQVAMLLEFIKLCVLPRALFSELDAIYTADFLWTMAKTSTQKLPVIFILDKLVLDISPLLFGLTENEADCFGRLLLHMLKPPFRWHNDKETIQKDGMFDALLTTVGKTVDKTPKGIHDKLRSLNKKWHDGLTRSVIAVLAVQNYSAMRNALKVLIKLLPVYPVMTVTSRDLEQHVGNVKENEKDDRHDISLLAASYLANLKRRSTPKLVEPSAFAPPLSTLQPAAARTANKTPTTAAASSRTTSLNVSGASSTGASDAKTAVAAPTSIHRKQAEKFLASTAPSAATETVAAGSAAVTAASAPAPSKATTAAAAQNATGGSGGGSGTRRVQLNKVSTSTVANAAQPQVHKATDEPKAPAAQQQNGTKAKTAQKDKEPTPIEKKRAKRPAENGTTSGEVDMKKSRTAGGSSKRSRSRTPQSKATGASTASTATRKTTSPKDVTQHRSRETKEYKSKEKKSSRDKSRDHRKSK